MGSLLIFVTISGLAGFIWGWVSGRRDGERSVLVGLYLWLRGGGQYSNDLHEALEHERKRRGITLDPVLRMPE